MFQRYVLFQIAMGNVRRGFHIHELPCKSEIDSLRRQLSLVKQEVEILVQKIKALDFESLANPIVNTDTKSTMSTPAIGQLLVNIS